MFKIVFQFRDKLFIKEFFFNIKEENWFGIKDEHGIWFDCCYNSITNQVFIYLNDTNVLVETSFGMNLAKYNLNLNY